MHNKFYQECATILTEISTSKYTLKSIIYKKKNPKKYMALLSQIIKHKEDYTSILDKLNLPARNIFLSLIYVHEVLNGNISVDNVITRSIKKLGNKIDRSKSIKTFYFRFSNVDGFYENSDSIVMDNNILKDENVNETNLSIKTDFIKQNASINDPEIYAESKIKTINADAVENPNDFLASINAEKTFIKRVYKTKHNIISTIFYRIHKLIIQNISSCIPAYLLNPLPHSKVIDCCASPGNKTSHLSNIMKNTGKIIAYEKDLTRFNTLSVNMKKYNCSNTETINMDFLEAEIDSSVEYLLVDPSCSGSGIHDLYVKDNSRVKRLATFQKKVLLHAMRFTGAKTVVYSTCSIHEEENEDVVQHVLERNNGFRLRTCENVFNGVECVKYGNEKYEFYKNVIRVNVDRENNIHGFFTAVFERNID